MAGMSVSWVGLGVMGRSMAGHLLGAGHKLRVYTRTKETAAALIDQGASWHSSPAEAAEGADVAISMVGYPRDVREVILGERGVLAATNKPMLVIDMTTSSPQLAQEIDQAASSFGVAALDAPVSGGDIGARNAALSIMVGGSDAAFTMATPLFSAMGKTIVHHGPAGAGQYCKIVNQILIASSMVGMCEALAFTKGAGLDPHKVISSVGGGAAGSWSVNNLGPRILRGDFAPGFYAEHFLKDLSIAVESAKSMGLKLDGLEKAEQLYARLVEQGHGRSGTQALWKLYE